MNIHAQLIATALASAVFMVGCSSDGGDSGTSLEVDKLVSELDEDEVATLCGDLGERLSDIEVDTFVDGICTLQGIVEAELGELSGEPVSCEAAAQSCVELYGAEVAAEVEDGPDCDAEFEQFAVACNVSVGELFTCIEDQVRQVEALAASVTCETDIEEVAEQVQPESCMSILADCPLPEDLEAPSLDS